jgi:hypothetical protein
MKRWIGILASAALLSSAAWAGEIYGKITTAGAAVAEGTSVEIQCGGKSFPATKTDKAGAYHFGVEATGKCTISVKQKDQSASLEIAAYDEPVQVDIVLEMKDGKLTARRK